MRRLLWLLTGGALLLTSATAVAADRKVVAKAAECEITAGDRDERGNNLMLCYCDWEVPLENLKAAFKNVEEHDTYMTSVVESTVLPDGRVLQVHQADGISDRQITLDFSEENFDDGGYKVSWTRSSKQEPLLDSRIDPPMDDGSWMVRPGEGGVNKVVYSLRYEPGGRVPGFIVRAFQKNGIAEVLVEMHEVASKMKP
jgi:hypothetical protein